MCMSNAGCEPPLNPPRFVGGEIFTCPAGGEGDFHLPRTQGGKISLAPHAGGEIFTYPASRGGKKTTTLCKERRKMVTSPPRSGGD